MPAVQINLYASQQTMQSPIDRSQAFQDMRIFLRSLPQYPSANETVFSENVTRVSWRGHIAVTVVLIPGKLSVMVGVNPSIAQRYKEKFEDNGGFYFDDDDNNVCEIALEAQKDVDFSMAELKSLLALL